MSAPAGRPSPFISRQQFPRRIEANALRAGPGQERRRPTAESGRQIHLLEPVPTRAIDMASSATCFWRHSERRYA